MATKLSFGRIATLLLLAALFTVSIVPVAHADPWYSLNFGNTGVSGAISGALNTISTLIGSATAVASAAINSVLGGVAAILGAAGLSALFPVILGWLFGPGIVCGMTGMGMGIGPMGSPGGVGQAICNVTASTVMFPGFITGISYMIGLICAVTALVKLKDHVIDPHRTPLSDSMKRFVAGGAFFSLPIVTTAAQNLIYGTGMGTLQTYGITRFEATGITGYGLDTMLIAFTADILQPIMILLGAFSYIAGIVLVVIGIGRMLKTAQEGPRGPTGTGTIMTFITAGILFSLGEVMGAFGTSIFGDTTIETIPILQQGTGDIAVDMRVEAVITSIIVFMFMVGWFSFIRGFFILRDVAEGNGQASLMAAMTHIFGGALAVNLGPVMNAVQSTFGLTTYGVAFF